VPIYEYACQACRHEFEELIRKPADERGVRCPKCQAAKIERKPSVFAAHAAGAAPQTLPTRACGRCGDPNGPCAQ
jgi:putative FmdB family regulatory protein